MCSAVYRNMMLTLMFVFSCPIDDQEYVAGLTSCSHTQEFVAPFGNNTFVRGSGTRRNSSGPTACCAEQPAPESKNTSDYCIEYPPKGGRTLVLLATKQDALLSHFTYKFHYGYRWECSLRQGGVTPCLHSKQIGDSSTNMKN